MSGENALKKTNRVNGLFDFYGPLLTTKQRMFLKSYFQDDYTLREIGADFQISRQAVYEHLKRAEQVLEDYEAKLALLSRHEKMQTIIRQLEEQIADLPECRRFSLAQTIEKLRKAELA